MEHYGACNKAFWAKNPFTTIRSLSIRDRMARNWECNNKIENDRIGMMTVKENCRAKNNSEFDELPLLTKKVAC